jgi:hypothetical protein
MVRALALTLVVLCVAWHGSVEGLPVETEGVVLLDDNVSKDAVQKHADEQKEVAKAKAEQTGDKAAQARAEVKALENGGATAAPMAAKASSPSIAQPTNMAHTTPGVAKVAIGKIAKTEKAKEHPEGEKYNGKIKVGQTGWLEEQIKQVTGQGTMKLDHQKFKIHNRLVRDEDAKWDEAQRKAKLAAATEAASQAAANMANAVEGQEANSVDKCKKVEDKTAAAIARLRAKNGIPCPNEESAQRRLLEEEDCPSKKALKQKRLAKLMLRWARQKRKCRAMLARAKGMGKAVNKMIMKAAKAQGHADASAKLAEEGTTELQRAIFAHAKAALALKMYRKQIGWKEQEAADDKAREQTAEAAQAKIEQEKEAAIEKHNAVQKIIKEKARQEATKQEMAFRNTPSKENDKDFRPRPLKPIGTSSTAPATASSAPKSHSALKTSVASALEQAHQDGTKTSADKAKQLVKQLSEHTKAKTTATMSKAKP